MKSKAAAPWGTAVRDGLILAAVIWLAALGLGIVKFGADAEAYWRTTQIPWYSVPVGGRSAFTYSPAFGQALALLAALPWPVFSVIWGGLMLAALAYLRPPLWLLAVLFVPLAFEFHAGNIHMFLAAAIAAGFRYPATWAFVLLTKVTPGIGLLWFAVRREWRSVGIALAATILIAALSIALAPRLWFEWFDYLRSSQQPTAMTALPIPLLWRLPFAIALVIWGARTNRRWTVPLAAWLALPVLWIGSPVMLLAWRPEKKVVPRAERAEDVAAHPVVAP